jgi:hypothetical protein
MNEMKEPPANKMFGAARPRQTTCPSLPAPGKIFEIKRIFQDISGPNPVARRL